MRIFHVPTTTIGLLLTSLIANADPRPNVLFILADDHQAGLVHAMGHPAIQTPNLDRLAERGMVFTNTHAEIPSCIPSRATMLTGTSGFTHKSMHPAYTRRLNQDLMPYTWPRTMQAAGYETFWTGKWHTRGGPHKWGIEKTSCVFHRGMGSHNLELEDPDGTTYQGFSSTVFADAAIRYLESRPEKPFFMTLAFTAPHDPRTPPEEFEALYDPATVLFPKNFMPGHPFDDGYLTIRDEKLLPRPRTESDVRREIALYYGMITQMDQQIGRVLDALEASGNADNTLIIFAGDHGLAVGHHGLLGKFSMYEHSTRTPLILAGPGIPRGNQSNALIYLHDLFPTVCDLVGADVPESVESESLKPIIDGKQDSVRDLIFCGHSHRQRMVRSDRYKFIRFYRDEEKGMGSNRVLFFDLENDPHELEDLSNNPEYQQLIQELGDALHTWQVERGDFLLDASPR